MKSQFETALKLTSLAFRLGILAGLCSNSVISYSLNLNCGKSTFADIRSLTHKVAVIGQDDRYLFSEYGKKRGLTEAQVEKLFGATGLIRCDGKMQQTAQLTGNNSVITTAAHGFFDQNCRGLNFKSCVFVIKRANEKVEFPVKMNSFVAGGCEKANRNIDWAVLELAKSVPKKINPYRLPKAGYSPSRGDKFINVSGASKNFRPDLYYPKYITECEVRDINVYQAYPIQTDCDTGGSSSGSAQLIPDGSDLVVAAIQASTTSNVDGAAYNATSTFNVSLPMAGSFLAATQAAIERTGGPAAR